MYAVISIGTLEVQQQVGVEQVDSAGETIIYNVYIINYIY